MLRRILVVIAIVAVFIGGWMLYTRNAERSRIGSGDVFSSDPASSNHSTADNTDLDGRPAGTVGPTPSRSDAPGTINGEPVPGATSNQPPDSMKAPIASANPSTNPPAHAPAGPLPVSDTIAPNPPNGLAFGGTGKFQWYRQGNLTWRVDTASGTSCIAFATMDEWRKPIVYTHGCGNS